MLTATRENTETRLLRAAERLFAARGPDAVSLRAVMQEADTNVAAVHYHFGSKEALVEAVVRSRIAEVSSAREELLEQAVSAGDVDARALARALVQPVVALVENGGRDWVRLVGQLLATNDPRLAPISDTFIERNAQFVELMTSLEPSASSETLNFRLTQAMSMTLHVLGDGETVQSLMSGSGAKPWTPDDVVRQLLDVVTSVLAGPSEGS